jgi:hypothetical protein
MRRKRWKEGEGGGDKWMLGSGLNGARGENDSK